MSSLYGFQDELTTVACEVLIAQSDAVDKAYYTHLLAVWYICKRYDDNVQPMLRTLQGFPGGRLEEIFQPEHGREEQTGDGVHGWL